MKAALLVSEEWLSQEQPTLRRTIVGLSDASVGVVLVAPRSLEDHPQEPWTISVEALGYTPSRVQWLRDRRILSLADRMRELEVDLIHALDESMASAGVALADAMDVPVIFSVWTTGGVQLVPEPEQDRSAIYAPASRELGRLLQDRLGQQAAVECIPPGVHRVAPGTFHPPFAAPDAPPCFVIVGNGRLDADSRALLEGIRTADPRLARSMFFYYTTGDDPHTVWEHAETLGLLDRLSMVPSGASARALLTRADALLLPQSLGAVRTVVLEAMAAARPVLAAPDPIADYLIDGVTARFPERREPSCWADGLYDLLQLKDACVRLGRSAQGYVVEHHSPSAFTASLHRLYDRLNSPGLIPFPG